MQLADGVVTSRDARDAITTVPRSQRGRWWGVVVAALRALGGAGCTPGVRWEVGAFQEVFARTSRQHKLTFVYFRNWYSIECTNFEEKVLKNVEVLFETTTMVNIPLDFDYDRVLAEQWDIAAVPAYVLLAPDGQVLALRNPPLTRDQLLTDIRDARYKLDAGGYAASPVPVTPPPPVTSQPARRPGRPTSRPAPLRFIAPAPATTPASRTGTHP